jgi:uncharacterized protein
MRIFAAGDIHGDTALAERLSQKAKDEKVDLVILCGDLTYGEQSFENIIGPFKKKLEKILIIPGNHETNATADFLAELYSIKNLHGESVKYNDIGIFGVGGANIGLFQLDEFEIYYLLKNSHEKIKYLNKKIMVTHVHPNNSLMERFSSFVPGSSGVKKAIDSLNPNILLCSHVHEAEGVEEIIGNTRVINVGKEGKIIDL